MFNGEYGHQIIAHNLPYELHKQIKPVSVAEKYASALLSPNGSPDILSTEELKQLVRHLVSQDINLTANQITPILRKAFPNSEILPKKSIVSQITSARLPSKSPPSLISNYKTLRQTAFCRLSTYSLISSTPLHFLYFSSDFQTSLAHRLSNHPRLHLFLDGTFKCCPYAYSQLFNVCLFCPDKKLYMPIAHVLMQSK
jgi:hypothetical protein